MDLKASSLREPVAIRWSMPRKLAFEAEISLVPLRQNVATQNILTVGGDGKLVSRCLVQEGALVEHLVAGLIAVGQSDLDLAVLELSQRDRERRVSLLQVNGSGTDSGHKGSESGDCKLHVG